MSYLPELRRSLLDAAARQVQPTIAPRARTSRRRRPLGAVALLAASLSAIVVAGGALVLVGHRAPSPSPESLPYGSRSAALQAAEQLLAAFRPPAGAIRVAHDPTHPATLGWVDGGLPVPSALDVSRFYLVRGTPESVISKLSAARSLGPAYAPVDLGPLGSSYGASSSSPGGQSSANMTMSLRGLGDLARQLVIETVPVGHGMVAMRVDAQSWWTARRPVQERIPTNARAIVIQRVGQPPKAAARYRSPARLTDPAQVRSTIAFLNSVSVAQGTSPPVRCSGAQFGMRLTFTGTGEHPDPIVIVYPSCDLAVVSLRGQPEPPLVLGSATNTISPLRGIELIELLMGAPQTTTWAQVEAEARRDQATSRGSRTAPATSGTRHGG